MRCLIIQEHPVTSLGLNVMINGVFPDWHIKCVETVSDAIEFLYEQHVDIALIDHSLQNHNGMKFLQYIRRSSWDKVVNCIVVSNEYAQDTIDQCNALGASGYIFKNSSIDVFIHALKTISSGGEYFCTGLTDVECPLVHNNIKLTARQLELLDLVLIGYSNKRIADSLKLSYGTVKNYMFDLMRILSVSSRLELAAKIGQLGYKARVHNHGTLVISNMNRKMDLSVSHYQR